MYLPQWLHVIRENNRKRREAFDQCNTNFVAIKPTALALGDWKGMSRTELEEAVKAMRQAHLVLLVDKMSYLNTLHLMGTLENLIYTPEIAEQQRVIDGWQESLEFMIETTAGYIQLVVEAQESGMVPDLIPKAFGG